MKNKIVSLALVASSFLATASVVHAFDGYAPRLSEIVVAYDRQDIEEDGSRYQFPARTIDGMVVRNDIRVSANCARTIEMKGGQLICSPNGDRSRSFVFAQLLDTVYENDSPMAYIRLKFDERRVRLDGRLLVIR